MQEYIRFFHGVNSGDLIAAMAGIKKVCEKYNRKAIIYQQLNRVADYYAGAKHPIQNNGEMVTMNQTQFDLIRPLVVSQDYVEDLIVFKGEKVDIDLDVIRSTAWCNIPFGAIQSWIFHAYPDMACDLTSKWIYASLILTCNLKDINNNIYSSTISDKIVLNFTERYRNPSIHFYFLNEYKDKLAFAGTNDEWERFNNQWELEIPRLMINDFSELASCIRSSLFLLSNQSMCWNIAAALGTPRILEMSNIAPNCQPFISEKNVGYFSQEVLLHHFNDFLN